MTLHLPQPLIGSEWLAARLDDPDLRLFDCTMFLHPEAPGKFRVENGSIPYASGHIPGAGLLDLQAELSVPDAPWRFTMPAPETLAATLARRGIGNDSGVVLYSGGTPSWATRVWWMLRAIGFDRAAVLDGGIAKWKAEGRPLSTEPCRYRPASLTIKPRPDLFVERGTVRDAIGRADILTINALTEAQHRGSGGPSYGRPGSIAGSVCIPSIALVAEDKTLRPVAELRSVFADIGATPDRRIICYCGGGIAATLNAFVLQALLGHRDVTVYDASMQEWAADPSLPMQVA